MGGLSNDLCSAIPLYIWRPSFSLSSPNLILKKDRVSEYILLLLEVMEQKKIGATLYFAANDFLGCRSLPFETPPQICKSNGAAED